MQTKIKVKKIKAIYSLIINVLWIGISLAISGVRTTNPKDNETNVLSHFTNWNWLILTSFLILDVMAFMNDELLSYIIGVAFWPTWTSCWLVFWLVILVLVDNPMILLENSNYFGGAYDTGLVFLMDRLLHVVIIAIIFLYFFLKYDQIILAALNIYYRSKNLYARIFYVVWNILLIPVVVGIYVSIFNVKSFYGFTWNIGYLFIEAVLVLVAFTVIPFIIVLFSARARFEKNKQKL